MYFYANQACAETLQCFMLQLLFRLNVQFFSVLMFWLGRGKDHVLPKKDVLKYPIKRGWNLSRGLLKKIQLFHTYKRGKHGGNGTIAYNTHKCEKQMKRNKESPTNKTRFDWLTFLFSYFLKPIHLGDLMMFGL